VAYSTLPDHECFRNHRGTVYIQTFCDVLDDNDLTNTMPMVDLLNEVSYRLGQIVINGKYVQTPDLRIVGTMQRKWYLPIRE
jgi:hypothetical protein